MKIILRGGPNDGQTMTVDDLHERVRLPVKIDAPEWVSRPQNKPPDVVEYVRSDGDEIDGMPVYSYDGDPVCFGSWSHRDSDCPKCKSRARCAQSRTCFGHFVAASSVCKRCPAAAACSGKQTKEEARPLRPGCPVCGGRTRVVIVPESDGEGGLIFRPESVRGRCTRGCPG